MTRQFFALLMPLSLLAATAGNLYAQGTYDAVAETRKLIDTLEVGKADWPTPKFQFRGT
jgi:hypothetical protein